MMYRLRRIDIEPEEPLRGQAIQVTPKVKTPALRLQMRCHENGRRLDITLTSVHVDQQPEKHSEINRAYG